MMEDLDASTFSRLLYSVDATTGYLMVPVISLAIAISVFAAVNKYERKGNLAIPFMAAMLFSVGMTIAEEFKNPYALAVVGIWLVGIIVVSIGGKITETLE